MNNLKDKIGTAHKNILMMLLLPSIQANINSLTAQLKEYDFLYVTVEEYNQIDGLEKQLHALVGQIVDRRS